MRNLKRALSLALASVMLLGMMVVGASAASYPDVDDNDNVEAIEVLNAVKVMIGDRGNFRPDDPVNRHEMAVIMAKLVLGNEAADNYVGTHPFTDVVPWADKYVAACYENGLVAGTSATTYSGGQPLTAVQAAAMMMRALGYKDLSKGANDWRAPVTAMANQIRLFSGVASNPSEQLNRNQVAQLSLNTLKSPVVDVKDGTFDITSGTGNGTVTISGGSREYIVRSSNEAYAKAINSTERAGTSASAVSGYTVELGEHLYNGKLKLYDNRTDSFGRPSRTWEYDGKGVGTYVKKDMLREEYTDTVTGKALYELLGKEVVDEYTFEITIDGETEKDVLTDVLLSEKDQYYFTKTALNRSNTNQVGGTGAGVLTQIFVDGEKKIVYISVINTYLATADTDYNTRREEVAFTIYGITQVNVKGVKSLVKYNDDTSVKVSGEDFDVKDVKSGDVVLVHVAGNEIEEILAPEVVEDTTISAFKNGSYVIAEGTRYDYASTAWYDRATLNQYANTNMKDTTYCIYLDPYGYLIGIEEIDAEVAYVFLTGINSKTENLKDQTAIGNVIFLDGTSKNVTINMKDSENAQGESFNGTTVLTYDSANKSGSDAAYNIRYDTKVSSLMNTWCTYSVDSDGVYTLKEVHNDGALGTAKVAQSHQGGTYYVVGQDTYFYATGSDTPATAGTAQSVNAAPANTGTLTFGVSGDGTNEKYVTINKGHVSLDGIANSAFKKVYGNNDTIYLTADLDIITADQTLRGGKYAPAVIITGASSVTTGVNNVDLTAYNAQAVVNSESKYQRDGMFYEDVSDGVYTLFNNKGYVIAAMVVGADDGSTTGFAWVSSDGMNRESYADGKWTYTRDVIIDGKEATLTEVESNGSTTPDIGKTGANYFVVGNDEWNSIWWEVKTKADGTVKELKKITTSGSSYDYITDIDNDDKDGTTVLEQQFPVFGEGATYKVRVTGSTLQVESQTGKIRGFHVAASANIAVVKDEQIYRGGVAQLEWNFKEDIQYFTNGADVSGLKQAVGALNDADNFTGWIAAILKDGQAVAVILYDWSDSEVDIGGQNNSQTKDVEVAVYTTQQTGSPSWIETYKLPSTGVATVASPELGGHYLPTSTTLGAALNNGKWTATASYTDYGPASGSTYKLRADVQLTTSDSMDTIKTITNAKLAGAYYDGVNEGYLVFLAKTSDGAKLFVDNDEVVAGPGVTTGTAGTQSYWSYDLSNLAFGTHWYQIIASDGVTIIAQGTFRVLE